MSRLRTRGFTLIELLTVIAIIAILTGITAAVLPRVLERAKVARTEADFKQVSLALATVQTDKGSLPPGYGYPLQAGPPWQDLNGDGIVGNDADKYVLQPYTVPTKLHQVKPYDEHWVETYDLNGNGHIDLMEFSPIGKKNPGTDFLVFPTEIYNGGNLPDETSQQLRSIRPYAYYPVNRAQADTFRKYCERTNTPASVVGNVPGSEFNTDPALSQLQFPPPFYDDYVLISPGPSNDLGGIIPADADLIQIPGKQEATYYVNALRIYFLATRDYNLNDPDPQKRFQGNGQLDFDFRARTRNNESWPMPNGLTTAGPLIYHPGS